MALTRSTPPDLPFDLPSDERNAVLRALRRLKGRATAPEVAGATGLSLDRTEGTLRSLVESHRGQLEATEDGSLVYSFPGGVVLREHTPLLLRGWRAFRGVAVGAFKLWTLLMLAGYSLLFALLALALLLALAVKGEGEGWEGGAELLWLPLRILFEVSFWFGIPGLPGRRAPRRLRGHTPGPPIPERIFRFLFGPPELSPSLAARNRRGAALAREGRGIVSWLDYLRSYGMRREEAAQELSRLTIALRGEFEVTPAGEVVSLFPELVRDTSRLRGRGKGGEGDPPPRPIWEAIPSPPAFSGNPGGTDRWIIGGNLFNLVAAGAFLMGGGALLGTRLPGVAALPGLELLLGWIPLAFSALSLTLPLLRIPSFRRRRALHRRLEARALLLETLYRGPREGGEGGWVDPTRIRGGGAGISPALLQEEMDRLAGELDAEVRVGEGGIPLYRAPLLRSLPDELRILREARALDREGLGGVVYSSGDSPEEEAHRALEAFDRQLRAGEPPPSP